MVSGQLSVVSHGKSRQFALKIRILTFAGGFPHSAPRIPQLEKSQTLFSAWDFSLSKFRLSPSSRSKSPDVDNANYSRMAVFHIVTFFSISGASRATGGQALRPGNDGLRMLLNHFVNLLSSRNCHSPEGNIAPQRQYVRRPAQLPQNFGVHLQWLK